MAKKSKRNQPVRTDVWRYSGIWAPLVLAAATFFIYWPSLNSDFVYDAREEILSEGFLNSLANLPAVLTLKVLSMKLMLGDRPGQLLYLMLTAAFWGKNPWGYHLGSNLLHATNVALLFVLLRRFLTKEQINLEDNSSKKILIATVVVTLIFALHPIAVEPVSGVSYSSDLLVAFFTLLALLAATAFRPDNLRTALLSGGAGVFCAFSAVACKESGISLTFILIAYWFLFRRAEAKGPWLLFLGAALAVSASFLAARFYFAPPSGGQFAPLGSSFFQIFLVQTRLWVFMMGQLLWPTHLSADYLLENVNGLSLPVALPILVLVVLLQIALAVKSRLGALGVAIYWLGLATVSNFIPLYRIVADRFYYLPLAGVAMQLLAALLLLLPMRRAFWITITPLLIALLPLTALTLNRQAVFANESSLWSDTLRVSPFSWVAHNNMGNDLLQRGQVDAAIAEFHKALAIDSSFAQVHLNLSNALLQKGQADAAMLQSREALKINPSYPEAHTDLGIALAQKGAMDAAIAEFQNELALHPGSANAHYNLGIACSQKGQLDAAIAEYEKALEINPDFAEAHTDLGVALSQKGLVADALTQFEAVVRLRPNDANAQTNLARALEMARQASGSR